MTKPETARSRVRIAILGTRGIPARYGGFETLAEELSARLAARGHDVTVYTRSRYAEPGIAEWRGARVRVLPTISSKYLDTVVHGVLSGFDAALERYDAVLVCNAINAASSFLPRLAGATRVVVNVDGLERNRRKWSVAGRWAYRLSERLSTIVPDAVVSDARVIQALLPGALRIRKRLHPVRRRPARARPAARRSSGSASSPEGYVLYVSRLEPENNADAVVRAYRDVPGKRPPGRRRRRALRGRLHRARETRGRSRASSFPGRSTGRATGSSSRTRPSTCRRRKSAERTPRSSRPSDTGAWSATTGHRRTRRWPRGAGLAFDVHRPETLSRLLKEILDDPPAYSVWKGRAVERVQERYRWEDVAERYEAVLEGRGLHLIRCGRLERLPSRGRQAMLKQKAQSSRPGRPRGRSRSDGDLAAARLPPPTGGAAATLSALLSAAPLSLRAVLLPPDPGPAALGTAALFGRLLPEPPHAPARRRDLGGRPRRFRRDGAPRPDRLWSAPRVREPLVPGHLRDIELPLPRDREDSPEAHFALGASARLQLPHGADRGHREQSLLDGGFRRGPSALGVSGSSATSTTTTAGRSGVETGGPVSGRSPTWRPCSSGTSWTS